MQEICSLNSDRFETIEPPRQRSDHAIASAPAYTCRNEIFASALMPESDEPNAPAVQREVGTTCFMFLVRIQKYGTDVLVYINVPKEPLERGGGAGAVAREEECGREIMERIIGSLEIVDYGLFGEE